MRNTDKMTDFDRLLAATKATLGRIAIEFSPVVFASSLAAEDMVLTDLILKSGLPIGIFTLETGRLHAETLAMLKQNKHTKNNENKTNHPDPAAVENYVNQNGLNAFYD